MYSYRRILPFAAAGLLLSTWVFGLQNRQVTDAALKNSGKTGDVTTMMPRCSRQCSRAASIRM